MENTNIVTTEQQAPNTISASNAIFNVQALGQLTAFANLMADSQVTVPAHLAGKPADCMAIVMQAMQWGMNPYAVAQKTHLVNGVLGYEAQLVNAVIASSSAIHGRFHYRYGGDWERCTRTQEITRDKNGKNGKYTVTERVRGWTDEDEIGLFVHRKSPARLAPGPARRSRQLTLMLLPTIFANALIQQVPLIRQKQSVRISNHRKRCWVLRCSPN